MSGPILFSAFINDIVYCFKHCKPILYADDLKVIFTIYPTKPEDSHILILHDLRNLSSWRTNNNYFVYYKIHNNYMLYSIGIKSLMYPNECTQLRTMNIILYIRMS